MIDADFLPNVPNLMPAVMNNKNVLMVILLVSICVSGYGFIYENGGLPANGAGYGAVLGRAFGFAIIPLLIYIIASFVARKRELEPNIKWWMIGVWAFYIYFGYIYELTHHV